MSQENVELLQSIFVDWERGEFVRVEWAHPEIEYVEVGGPQPGKWAGVSQMEKAWAEVLRAWDEFRIEAEHYQALDDERVLVLVRPSGHGRTSGLDIQEMHAEGAVLFTVRDGAVTKFAIYWDRDRAYADLAPNNVDLVQAMNAAFAAEGDAVALFRNEERIDRLFTAGMPLFHESFETVVRGWPAGERTYPGFAGQRSFWKDWLAPWVEYRQELWKTIDLGDRVLVLFHDYGRRSDSTHEIRGETAGIWTVRDGQIIRMEFFLSPAEALKAAGLEE